MPTHPHQCRSPAPALVLVVVLAFFQLISSIPQQSQLVASSPLVPALIVFGDSTVDVGMNNNLTTVVRANFRPYGRDFIDARPTGRFCNGRLPVDFVATMLGLPYPLAYFDSNANGQNIVHGINFASSASGYYDDTAKFFNVLSLTKQLEFFLSYQSQLAAVIGSNEATYVISEALYILSTGSNDFANNYFFNLRLRRRVTVDQFINLLLQSAANFLETLYQSGARKLGVVSVPPVGCVPAQRSLVHGLSNFSNCVEIENEAALAFNSGLQNLIQTFTEKYPDYKVIYLDSYPPIQDIYQNPGKYGIEDVTRACCSTGTVETAILCNRFDSALSCPDASKYMFWDSYHPTETVYHVLADEFFQIVAAANIL